jgi:hypothetical protein
MPDTRPGCPCRQSVSRLRMGQISFTRSVWTNMFLKKNPLSLRFPFHWTVHPYELKNLILGICESIPKKIRNRCCSKMSRNLRTQTQLAGRFHVRCSYWRGRTTQSNPSGCASLHSDQGHTDPERECVSGLSWVRTRPWLRINVLIEIQRKTDEKKG